MSTGVAEARIPHIRVIVAIAALAAAAIILWLARSFTFYFDEWTFILGAPEWTWATLLQPHNEHPVMLTRAIYAALLSTVGIRSYLPYMASLLALHAAGVVLLFEIVRRRAGDVLGLAAAALLALLGAGWEDLLWAFQLQFIGSVACGLGMLLALEARPNRRNLLMAAALLTASLMFSGVGLFFGVAAVVQLAATPLRRRALVWLAPTGVALGAWYLALGHDYEPNGPPALAATAELPLYVTWGLGTSAGGLIGVSGFAGLVVLAAAGLAVGFSWRRGGISAFGLGALVGLVAFYAVTGLIRVQFGYQQSGASRYTYVGAVFCLLLLADAARNVRWRGAQGAALAACVLLACLSSGALLYSAAAARGVTMQRQIADLQALAAVRGNPCLDPNGAVDPLVMPVETQPAVYYAAVARYGDPAAGLPVVDRDDYERARANLLKPGCT